ncbi:MAG TPA: hypothetical protein VE010_09410, partial [Thermoanaerobaculia bacterium]|nr:hypothetical protein [Thermoanaerobaculia bacterium]
IAVVTLIALAYALSGFPAAMAYGAWVVIAYALYLLVRVVVERRRARRSVRWPGALKLVAPLAGVLLGLVIAMPSLVPFAQLLERSGYLEVREKASLAGVFPSAHLRSFVQPDRLGHHAYKNWLGDPRLGALNNYPESTIYLGLLTLPLLLLAIFNRRARQRWFWLACGAFILACMFGAPLVAPFVATIPGFKFSALARLTLLLPIPAGYLAAAGARLLRKPLLIYGAAAIIAFDLALLAGRFYPYLEPRIAEVPVTPMTQFVRAEKAPFRVAPFFDYFWPNTAELVRFEDVRSHFGSELAYRRMLLRLDPTAWTGSSTVLTFNSLQYKFDDPLAALLGIRWYIEQKDIDIIRWLLFSATKPAVQEVSGWVPLPNGVALQRTVRIDAEPFWSIELPVRIDDAQPNARIDVALLKNGAAVWSRAFSREDATALGKVYIPVRPYARLGEQLTLRVRGNGVKAFLLEGANDIAGEARIFYGRVTIPIVFDRELPDGRLFRNVGELPRFRAVSKLRKLNDEEFLAARDVDFATEAVITDDPVMPPELGPANAQVTLASYAADEQRVLTQSDAPFFLASSEKLTPELRVTLDGRAVRAVETDSVFAGVQVPAGTHELVFSRRIARGWWWAAIAGVAIWIAVAISEIVVERRASARRTIKRRRATARRSTGTEPSPTSSLQPE